MPDELTTCEACGASLKKWKHNLTRPLVITFLKFCDTVKKKGMNSVNLQTEMQLTKNQYNNFQKLRYFGLVAKDRKKHGSWVITRWGGKFMRNELAIPRQVISFRNHIVERIGTVVILQNYFNKADDPAFDSWQQDFKFDEGEASYEEIGTTTV